MDENLGNDTLPAPVDPADTLLEEASAEYVGRWNHLVSTTNWEKGRIISQWRASLMEAGSPQQEYSDESWSRTVGNVSGQHVGRLRRVYEQFGEVFEDYAGLYWSHFQAALDWSDAEMWLEGAVQSRWSVAQMRAQRWEATGAPADQEPREEDVITAELDEDAELFDGRTPDSIGESEGMVHDFDDRPVDEDRADDSAEFDDVPVPGDPASPTDERAAVDPVRPFENLPPLPDDLSEPFEAMKLAIINHKSTNWAEISCSDLLAALDALKHLALAPA